MLSNPKTVLEHAMFYNDRGCETFPLHSAIEKNGQLYCTCGKQDCTSAGKHPVWQLAPKGYKNASKSADRTHYFFAGRRHNIGIATGQQSGIVALDVDPRHGGDESFAALEAAHGPLPVTWRFITGGGGQHILFRHPGVAIPNSANKVGQGLDIRGDGGYIVAPPSRHISGNFYRISEEHDPRHVELAEVPDCLFEKIKANNETTQKRQASKLQDRLPLGVSEGERNDTVARVSGLLIGKGVDPHTCLDLLLAFNDARCSPPLDDEEVANTVASIWKCENRTRRK